MTKRKATKRKAATPEGGFRHLVAEYRETGKGKVILRIVEQTHRNDNFTSDGEIFHHGGIYLESCAVPENTFRFPYKTLYVRGDDRKQDDAELELTMAQLTKVKAAIKAYNNQPVGYKWTRIE